MVDSNVINEILTKHKTPFYVFEQREFEKNYIHLEEAFRRIYPNYQIAYSYKTNYTPYICKCVKALGGYAEIVSDMEYTLAKQLGYENRRIIYNGPCKGERLEEHLINGGISNIDNKDEADRVIEFAKKNPDITVRIGLRINSDIGANYTSRFGLEVDSDELKLVTDKLHGQKNIKITGVHCHVSRARGLEAWKRRIENMLYAADKYCDGIPEYIDVGSGMFGEMEDSLAVQFESPVPTYAQYAIIVAGTMSDHYAKAEAKPTLFSEPGTTVVAKYLSLVTAVRQKKTIQNKCFVTVDSSYYNTGEICLMKKLPYRILPEKQRKSSNLPTDIMGFTCLEQDCIYRDFDKQLETGDTIVFGNVGGYSIVSKPPFIQPNCPVFCLDKNDEIIEIKRQETYDDVFRTFSF